MAFSLSNITKTVFGNQRVVTALLTADAVSGVVSFGLGTLTGISVTSQSQTTNGSGANARFRLNQTAAGGASQGDLGVSGVVSGDEFLVVVYGH